MVMKISELQAEADQLRARCETAEGLNIDLGQQVEAMVQLRCVIIGSIVILCFNMSASLSVHAVYLYLYLYH